MKKIKLFLDPILYFMEDSSGFASQHYLDLLKGEVVSPDVDDTISDEDLDDDDRYFPIEPITSDQGYDIMQDFAALEQSDEIRGHLISALEGKKPFRSFKDALAEYPDVEKRFFEYKGNRLKDMLKKQLAECGYTLEEESFPKGS
ncbi:MAG: UPF0158 family protein [Thermodesulfobacteriota bacterium]|nr:UPF0158 family protein [Thermodesulfobacteriota bacterium]